MTRAGQMARSTPAERGALPPPRIVIDTNIVLDLFVFTDPVVQQLLPLLHAGQLQWLATASMRDELARVLAYPHIAARLAAARQDAAHVLTQFDALASLKPAAARANYVCKDTDDQVFIDLALAYQTLLLSKDRAVLAMTRRLARLGVVVCGDWLALAQAAGL